MGNQSVKDFVNTPMGNNNFGVTFHATVVDQLIRAARANTSTASGAPLRQWKSSTQDAWLALFCALGTAIAWGIRPPGRYFAGVLGVSMVGLSAAGVLVGLAVIVIGSFDSNFWIPSVSPVIGFFIGAGLITLYSSVSGRLDRRAMMKLFSWCVAEDVAKEIWTHRESIFTNGELTPRRMRATLLFTDLVGFSTRAEGVEPEEVMRWLKRYFEGMAGLVNLNHGNVNKFNGDQIIAIFGPPIERNREQAAEDARNAVRCALLMRKELASFNRDWCGAESKTCMRIGIHTGWVVAGSLGTRGRLEWTVIGNDVNLAARLESTHKQRMGPDDAPEGCRILISSRTRKLLDQSFSTKLFGLLKVKGLSKRVRTYTVTEANAGITAAVPANQSKSLASPSQLEHS